MNFYQIVFLFFAYSFLGWVGEVLFTAVVHRKYQDRGVLSGPLCLLYGVGGLVITFALGDIREGWFFLLVFSAVYATVIEWIGGHILEYTTHTQWWDYTGTVTGTDKITKKNVNTRFTCSVFYLGSSKSFTAFVIPEDN